MRALSLFVGLCVCATSSFPWENHALLTTLAIKNMPELKGVPPVKVETLEAFLTSERLAIAELLTEEETWASLYVPNYRPRPAFLAFQGNTADAATLLKNFVAAIRVNPSSKFALFLQEMPGAKTPGTLELARSAVTLLPNTLPPTSRFIALKSGQLVTPAEVFATATDEPDYGLDIKVWTDSGTEFGRRYGFGPQPFGNAKLEFGTQAPLHMGFYHEDGLIDFTAPQITLGLPEYRIHLFYSLARLAFRTNHSYWGWRFAGMGAHYIQDLTQPYHAKLLPGGGTFKLLYTGVLDQIGMHGPREKLVAQASDEHLALENQAYCSVLSAFEPGGSNDPLASALGASADDKELYKSSYVRNILTAQAYDLADEVAEALRPMLGSAKPGCSIPNSPKAQSLFARLMKNFGDHTRGFIRAILR